MTQTPINLRPARQEDAPALRLYNRHGFREFARRTITKDGWDYGGNQWILLVKQLAGAASGFEPEIVHHSGVHPGQERYFTMPATG